MSDLTLKKRFTVIMQIMAVVDAKDQQMAEAVLWRGVNVGALICGNVQAIGCEAKEMTDDVLRQMGIDPNKLRTD